MRSSSTDFSCSWPHAASEHSKQATASAIFMTTILHRLRTRALTKSETGRQTRSAARGPGGHYRGTGAANTARAARATITNHRGAGASVPAPYTSRTSGSRWRSRQR